MVLSLVEHIENFNSHKVSLLCIDKYEGSDFSKKRSTYKSSFHSIQYISKKEILDLEKANYQIYDSINYPIHLDSVQRARIQLQLVLKAQWERVKNCIIWQLDDDLLFEQVQLKENRLVYVQKLDYFSLIREYHKKFPDVDACIGSCSIVPPVPVLFYLRKQLEDLRNPIPASSTIPATKNYYHDLYDPNCPPVLNPEKGNFQEAIIDAIQGKMVSRPLLFPPEETLALGEKAVFRGANFIIFNPKLAIKIPHVGFLYKNVLSRRSDMINAWMLDKAGFNLRAIYLPLVHNRWFGTLNIEKLYKTYFADSIGALVYRYLNKGEAEVITRIKKQQIHLKELSKTIDALKKEHKLEELETLHITNNRYQEKLAQLQITDLIKELKTFKALVNSVILDTSTQGFD